MNSGEIYGWVKDLPIVDWHNHLDLKAIEEDRPFGSLYEVWVKPDPYKHRAMRICGVPERLITGGAPDAEKMAAWEATLPKLVGNPLFAWSRMEMDFLKAHPLETLTTKRALRAFKVEYWDPGFRMNAGDAFDRAAAELRYGDTLTVLGDVQMGDAKLPLGTHVTVEENGIFHLPTAADMPNRFTTTQVTTDENGRVLTCDYVVNEEALQMGIRGLNLIACFYIFMGLQNVIGGSLRGAGASVASAISSVLMSASVTTRSATFVSNQRPSAWWL